MRIHFLIQARLGQRDLALLRENAIEKVNLHETSFAWRRIYARDHSLNHPCPTYDSLEDVLRSDLFV